MVTTHLFQLLSPLVISMLQLLNDNYLHELSHPTLARMKLICDHRSELQFKQLRNSPKKKFFGASRGFEPVASAFALQCYTSLSYEDPYTESRPIY